MTAGFSYVNESSSLYPVADTLISKLEPSANGA